MFHPVSLIVPLLILLPNLLFFQLEPQNMPDKTTRNSFFTGAEFIGRMGVIIVPLFCSLHMQNGLEVLALIVMLLSLGIYYYGWGRYFRNGRPYRLLFTPLMGIPVPLALSPVLYFLSASVILHSGYLLIFSLILGAGHIPASLSDYRRNA
ncbi:hypothetical protein AMQ84_16610 [Paenibacillus riograndensis]|uniref:Uncharacterized protein n=1 Tax=Paenibacillus riograndensis TaxID=483937 RepID=A0A132TXU3_9BACL|nr:hypothetical protein [Paenibacillus riograndensis]KWX75966.1 hypothetical protein AMQ84_16610 [Paenibacillus riograndensis]